MNSTCCAPIFLVAIIINNVTTYYILNFSDHLCMIANKCRPESCLRLQAPNSKGPPDRYSYFKSTSSGEEIKTSYVSKW